MTDDPVRESGADAAEVESTIQSWTGIQRILALAGAMLCLVLGVLGLLLPIVPATPFVLLASYLLIRSSPALHLRLKRSRLFGRLVSDWEKHGGIRRRDRIRAIVVVILCGSISLLVLRPQGLQLIIAIAVLAFGLLVILRLPRANQ